MTTETNQTPAPAPVEPTPGSAEYNAAMAAKYDAQVAPPAEAPEAPPAPAVPARPEWAPEEFYNAETGAVDTEALAKAYASLRTPEAPKAADAESKPAGAEGEQSAATDALDFASLGAQINQTGGLDDKTFAALEARGLPKDLVQDYIALATARRESDLQVRYEAAGGKEQFEALIAWGKANLKPTQLGTYEELLTGEDYKEGIALLQAKSGLAPAPREPGALGTVPQPTGLVPFRSQAEMVTAMGDPRYKTDPAYRAQVQQRLAVSNI